MPTTYRFERVIDGELVAEEDHAGAMARMYAHPCPSELLDHLALNSRTVTFEGMNVTPYVDTTAEHLSPGDVIIDHLYGRPLVTILRWAEWHMDHLLGRHIMRFWARREDTGTEGYMSYGPGGFVRIKP